MKTKFVKRDSYAEGVTSRGIVFKFSLEDWEFVTRHSWCVDPRGYLAATYNKKHTVLHRLIMNAPKGYVTDHINGDKLDNRRENLRICTQHQNTMNNKVSKNNKLGVKGVSLTLFGKYRARIMFNGVEIRLGHYETLEEATKARKQAECKYFGEYARDEK